MQYRLDKRSGNNLSILGFGCMRFPRILGRIDMHKTEEMIMRSIEMGVNYFDTAWIYPGSEEALGSVIKKNNIREKIYIATKLPFMFIKSEGNSRANASADFDKYLNQSLARLKTDYVDYYLIHMLSDLDQWKNLKKLGIEEWIAEKKESGQVKHIGFSFHGSASEFIKIVDDFDWELCLIQYNYSDENYQAGVTGLRAASEKMPVVIMEPLLGGKLADGLPKDAVKIFKNADASEQRPALSPVGWALNWLWNQKEVTALISGMSGMEQLEENLHIADAAYAGMLGENQKAVYKSVLELVNRACKVRCTGCNYCMPCPAGVNIPGSFSAYNAMYAHGYVTGMKQFIQSTGFFYKKGSSPGLCIKCGKCESHCPQNIPITKELLNVQKRMEPWFIKFFGICARAFLGKSRKKADEM